MLGLRIPGAATFFKSRLRVQRISALEFLGVMMKQPSFKLLTIRDAAELTKLHPNTIRNLIAREELKAVRIGRNIRIHEETLLSFVTPYQGGEFGVWSNL